MKRLRPSSREGKFDHIAGTGANINFLCALRIRPASVVNRSVDLFGKVRPARFLRVTTGGIASERCPPMPGGETLNITFCRAGSSGTAERSTRREATKTG